MPNSVYSNIRFGSEVYTWFMKDSGRANANRLDHMIEIIAQAGFRGIQPIYSWMGDLGDPGRLAASLSARGLELCAMSFVLDWNHEQETEEERQQADGVIDFLTHFPGALLCVVQMPRGRFDVAIAAETTCRQPQRRGPPRRGPRHRYHVSPEFAADLHYANPRGLRGAPGRAGREGHRLDARCGTHCQRRHGPPGDHAAICRADQSPALQRLGRPAGIRRDGRREDRFCGYHPLAPRSDISPAGSSAKTKANARLTIRTA